MAKEKPKHFELLKKLFYNEDGSIKKTWGTLVYSTKYKYKWLRLREYCASITDSGTYGELRYLFEHNWEYKKCLICGQPTKWSGGHYYHDYCSHKCAAVFSNKKESTDKRKETRKHHREEMLNKVSDWTIEELSSHDEEMINFLTNGVDDNGKVIYSSNFIKSKTSHSDKYVNAIFWMNNRIFWANNWAETLFCICHHITEQPVCKICGNPVKFDGSKGRYNIYCSVQCLGRDEERRIYMSKISKANGKDRGRKISKTKQARTEEQKEKEKLKQWITNELGGGYNKKMMAVDKMKQTNLEKGGHTCSLHRSDIKGTYTIDRLKQKEASILGGHKKSAQFNSDPQYGIDLSEVLKYTWALKGKDGRKAAIEGYKQWYYSGGIERMLEQKEKRSNGVKKWYDSKTPEQREIEFNNRIYGMFTVWLDSVATHEDLQELGIPSIDIINKTWWNSQDKLYKERVYGYICKTSKRGKPRSQEEDDLYLYILARFSDVQRNFPTNKYPWQCDFYIPSIDTYIEYNGYPSHGKHPYDINSEADNEIVNDWLEKGYKDWVYNWTIVDVLKRYTAIENNLNYFECWTIKEAEELVDNIYKKFI